MLVPDGGQPHQISQNREGNSEQIRIKQTSKHPKKLALGLVGRRVAVHLAPLAKIRDARVVAVNAKHLVHGGALEGGMRRGEKRTTGRHEDNDI